MAITPVTPLPGLTHEVVTAGTAVTVAPGGINGGFITNPSDAPGSLFVSPVVAATTTGIDTTFEIVPGQSWPMIPGQTTPTSVNSLNNAHFFSVVYY